MLLLVGLGNPGDKYARHRHNVGFMAVDAIADAAGFSPARSKFQGELREGLLGGEKTLILKPQTYMNDSGRSVGEAARFYKIAPEDIVVFYDELDLAPGKIRMKTGGGAAGHNGIRSIDAHIGNNFRRVRIGIGHPGDKSRVTGHVLGDFSKTDQDWLGPMLEAIAGAAAHLADGDDNRFQTAVAQKLAPQRKPAPAKPLEKDDPPAVKSASPEPKGSKSPLNVFAEVFKKRGDKEN
ncbi:aminoacyl-tRNA hydrolase [Hyphococcus luteus]|uniref:Peptidyl-tRNA hydrolase n=1 Tax=Hyphococcus luteus TaxID=2058213 RepID=A0A2S7K2Q1_9PROT|nr:aminoacyl-tRNA hydrolase [Marinicaulis flavus]PQA86782.1 aminoacyl-tRNA hydrolase [Marinicaulis flavus]